jgi:hypothetical protein
MTITEAKTQLAALKPNFATDAQIVLWLSNLDNEIWNNVISMHENTAPADAVDDDGNTITDLPDPTPYEIVKGEGEDPDTLPDVTLLVPEPYSEMYLHYLAAQIDYWDGEYTRYNNAMAAFNAKYDEYIGWFKRNHMPKQPNYIAV